MSPDAVTAMDIRKYFDQVVKRPGVGPHPVNRARASLRRFFGWLEDAGEIPDNPTVNIKPEKVKRDRAPKSLSSADLNALLRVARSTGFRRDRVRNTMIVQVLVQTGLRLSELIELRWKDLDIGERKGILQVRDGKGRKPRSLPLNSTARKVLGDWRKRLRDRRRRLPDHVACGFRGESLTKRGVQYLLRELGQRARLDSGHITPHLLRHTYATLFLSRHPGDIVALAALLGHDSIATTAIYTRPAPADLAAKNEAIPQNAYG